MCSKRCVINTTIPLSFLVLADPPDGVPTCSILPVNNYTDLALFCSWKGGYPPATLKWSPYVNGNNKGGIINTTLILPGPDTANNSVFTCHGTHVALNNAQNCSTRTCEYEIADSSYDEMCNNFIFF